ncbi:MAG: hypothetical protein JKX78_15115 [Alteromonadaceae bacterium]|nr:hypothetical protein [Alteromonadaceae bacterium]
MAEIKQLTDEQKENLSLFKIHKIKKPQEYGGWSPLINMTVIVPIVGFVFGVIGLRSENEIKKIQGQGLLIGSIALFAYYILK